MFVERKKERKLEIPQASLPDIVFLLLTFFLLTTTIDVDKGIGLALPPKGETKEVRKENIANLLINASGQVMLDKQPIEIRMIREAIKMRLAERPQLIVSVKTDRRTPYEVFIAVLDQVKQAKAPRISIAEPES
ncbi:MAG: biopolymer transporter ExbD [candidate division KSB1 bacterium]|nr:biopolymer transporter ExbD [candidate division KSB1 bacterium]MDZ7295377.1 biopolymer transporter ExbD [candidate division KSB1 bacterium]MDZ7337882.1 biopolymer transporter ExbD [candidate division KSB1 bacterium]MDZ7377777.1 biopolymer transporter ExbD [candidate division KSB1 bacterium]MDZ7385274.1 biopolymer transporter ExbD [candidate division KSB1 bacterium]